MNVLMEQEPQLLDVWRNVLFEYLSPSEYWTRLRYTELLQDLFNPSRYHCTRCTRLLEGLPMLVVSGVFYRGPYKAVCSQHCAAPSRWMMRDFDGKVYPIFDVVDWRKRVLTRNRNERTLFMQ
jgi:hypothetical protein